MADSSQILNHQGTEYLVIGTLPDAAEALEPGDRLILEGLAVETDGEGYKVLADEPRVVETTDQEADTVEELVGRYAEVSEPEEAGATAKKYGKFFEVAHGSYRVGVWREHLFELFLDGGKLSGRYLIEYAPIGGRRIWIVDRPQDQTPYAEKHKLEDVLAELKKKGQAHLVWSDGQSEPVLYDTATGKPAEAEAAKAKRGEGGGHWVTIEGRHVFIEDEDRTIGQGGTKLVTEGKISKRTVEKFIGEFESLPSWAQEGIKELKLEAEAGAGFNAGGQQFVEGGHWEASDKRIAIANAKAKSKGSGSAIAHEVGHSMFDRLRASAIGEEYKLIEKHPDWFEAGTLLQARRLKAKYIGQAESSGGRNLAAMTKYRDLWSKGEDGISSYSKAWAKESAYSGQTETFAEMSKVYFGMAARGGVNRDVFLAHCSGARGLGEVFLEVTDIMKAGHD